VDLGSHTIDGVVGGGQIGCDYQAGGWVIGIQGMFDWADLDGSNVWPTAAAVNHTHVPWITTLTGRIGFLATPATLLYFRGGGAWARDEFTVTTLPGVTLATADVTRNGWTVGVGIEQSFASYFSVFAEYNYLDFWRHATTFSDASVLRVRQDVHLLTVGFNLRFSPFAR
jgi:outer membrane immunogenic protein